MALTAVVANASGTDAGNAGASPASWSHTITGNANRVLRVIAGWDQTQVNGDPSMTYNGSSTGVTRIFWAGYVSSSDRPVAIWEIKEADLPAAGTYTVAISWSTMTGAYVACAIEYYDNDQTTPSDTPVSNETSGTDPQATTPSAVGDLVMGICFQNSWTANAPANRPLADSGTQTLFYGYDTTNSQCALRVAEWAGDTNVTVDFTSMFDQYRVVALNINAVASVTAAPQRGMLLGIGR